MNMYFFNFFSYDFTRELSNTSLPYYLNSEFQTDLVNFIYKKDLIGHYFLGIATLTISCIGFLGNVLSIGVLTSKLMRGTTTNLYLIALAASDAMMLLFAIFVAIRDARVPQVGVHSWELWQDYPLVPKLYPFCHAFAILFQVFSNWLTAAFTIDRYLMICHPFHAKRVCTIQRSKFIIACIAVVSIIYTIPRFLEYSYFDLSDNPLIYTNSPLSSSSSPSSSPTTQSSSPSISPSHFSLSFPEIMDGIEDGKMSLPTSWYRLSEMGSSISFRKGYHLWAWCILVIGIPSLIIAVLNIFLVKEINKSIKRIRFERGVKTRRHETDVMLIGVIVIFLVCQIPSTVSHVLWGIQEDSVNSSISWLVINEIGNLLVILNASINIIPYYMFSIKFRIIFVHIYFPWIFVLKRKRTNTLGRKSLCRIRNLSHHPRLRGNQESEPYIFLVVENNR